MAEIIDLSEEVEEYCVEKSEMTIGRRRSSRKKLYVDYTDCFPDSDDEKVQSQKKFVDTFVEISNLNVNNLKLPDRIAKIRFLKHEINLEHFYSFFSRYGCHLECLSFETINLTLLSIVAKYCPQLETLKIRETSTPVDDSKFRYMIQGQLKSDNARKTRALLSGSLQKLAFERNDFLIANLVPTLDMIPSSLTAFSYSYRDQADLSQVLDVLKLKSSWFNSLSSLTIQYSQAKQNCEDIPIRQCHLRTISECGFKLQTLELICGLWEDIEASDIHCLLTKLSPSLYNFNVAGNIQGVDIADSQLKISIPEMPILRSFSMGIFYEFEHDIQDLPNANENTQSLNQSTQHSISLLSTSLVAIQVTFPVVMMNLESLRLGNLVSIDQISPKIFPHLRSLCIGSNWTPTLKIPMSHNAPDFPIFSHVRELQIPDFMADQYFIMKIRHIFPALRSVTMNLPNVQCLRQFIETMAGSELEKLYLLTQYDFKGTLEYVLGVSTSSDKEKQGIVIMNQSDSCEGPEWSSSKFGFSFEKLLKLKNPKNEQNFNDFLKFYNIQIPCKATNPCEQEQKAIGIDDLWNLRTLVMGHIPRTIRIPLDFSLPHNHASQVYDRFHLIGFKEYPLSESFFTIVLKKLRNLDVFRHGSYIKAPETYNLANVVDYHASSHYNYRDKNAFNCDDEVHWTLADTEQELLDVWSECRSKNNLKVRTRACMVASEQFRVKKEDWTSSKRPLGVQPSSSHRMKIEKD